MNNLTPSQLKALELAFARHAEATKVLYAPGQYDEQRYRELEASRDEALKELGLPGLNEMFRIAYATPKE